MDHPQKVTDGQVLSLRRLFDNKVELLSIYLEKDTISFYGVLRSDWEQIRDSAFEHWHEDDWTVCQWFKNAISRCKDELEKRNGQQFFNFTTEVDK